MWRDVANKRLICDTVSQIKNYDTGVANTITLILLSWTGLLRQKLCTRYIIARTLARYGRLSRGRGTSSDTIKRMTFARAAGFDGSIGWSSVAS